MAEKPGRDLLADLEEQRYFLNASNQLYDQGNHSEAKRLAVTIRVLVHDTAKSRSLLSMLGVKSDLRWITVGRVDPQNLMSTLSLTALHLTTTPEGGSFEYVPHIEERILEKGRLVDFDT